MRNIKKQRQTPNTVLWSVMLLGALMLFSVACGRKASPIQPDVPPVVKPEKPGAGEEPKEPPTPPVTPPVPQVQTLSLTGKFVSFPAFEDVPCGVLVVLERDV